MSFQPKENSPFSTSTFIAVNVCVVFMFFSFFQISTAYVQPDKLENKTITKSKLKKSKNTKKDKEPNPWKLKISKDLMDESNTVVISRDAENYITYWPGETTQPVLVLRCKRDKTEVYIITGATAEPEYGLFEEVHFRLKFDKGKPKSYIFSESTSRDAYFAPQPISLIRKMLKHKVLYVEFTPFQSNPQVIKFKLDRLDEVIGKLKKACHWK